MIRELPALAAALNRQSYEYLLDELPGIADALAVEVSRGATAVELRRFTERYTSRPRRAGRGASDSHGPGGATIPAPPPPPPAAAAARHARTRVEVFECRRIPGYGALVWHYHGLRDHVYHVAFGPTRAAVEREAADWAAALGRWGAAGVAI